VGTCVYETLVSARNTVCSDNYWRIYPEPIHKRLARLEHLNLADLPAFSFAKVTADKRHLNEKRETSDDKAAG
jgi:hypothetical protein